MFGRLVIGGGLFFLHEKLFGFPKLIGFTASRDAVCIKEKLPDQFSYEYDQPGRF
jgi:hypothetical protein